MIISVLTGMAVLLSWELGLAFSKMKIWAVQFNAVIAALISMILCELMRRTGCMEYFMPVILLIYLFEAVMLQIRSSYASGFLSLLIALASFAAFIPLFRLSVSGLVSSFCLLAAEGALAALSAVFFLLLNGRFPETDWQTYFSDSTQAPERLRLKKEYVFFAAMLPAVCNMLLLLFDVYSLLSGIILSAAALALLWMSIIVIILMTSYKKERIAMLLEQQYHAEMQSFMNVIRSQRHDYNFHVQTLSALMQNNKMDECRDYLRALEKDSDDMNHLIPVADPAIGAIIFSFQRLAVRAGISLYCDIEYDLSQIASNVYETNKIIANLLQNAIDEVSGHKDKSYGIHLLIIKRGEYCVIRVSNKMETTPSAEDMGKMYRQGYTTKPGHEGVGLSSIRLLAQRYNGTVYGQTEDDIIHMVAKIPINISKKQDF